MQETYANFLEINPNFESVVDIGADSRNQNLWRDYIIGNDMEDLMEKMCQSLGNEDPDARRSFWVHGSYGTGKSYAGIFIKHLLEEKPEVVEDFLAKSHRLAKFKNRFMKCRKNGEYLVIWKEGCIGVRTDDMLLIEATKAVEDALKEKFGGKAYLGTNSLASVVQKFLKDSAYNWEDIRKTTALADDFDNMEILSSAVESGDLNAIQAVAQVIREKGWGLVNNLDSFRAWIKDVIENNGLSKSGIFIIWDEFTEYVANADGHTILQQISEYSKVQPFFVMFILHKTDELVASVGGQTNYQKISDRFHVTEFHLTADASLDLIAGSIKVRTGMEQIWADRRKDVVARIHPHLPDMGGLDDKMPQMIDELCPMHPMTIRLLSTVSENFAGEKRTLFRFMKDSDNEKLGFARYIKTYGPDDEASWLTPDWLWDYFFMSESDIREGNSNVAALVSHYQENFELVEKSDEALRLFKTIMLLLAVNLSRKGMYVKQKNKENIPTTLESLELTMAGVMEKARVDDLVKTLEDNRLIVQDKAANGVVRLELPFKNDGGEFEHKFKDNEKKYSRYQMWSKDGEFAKAFEQKCNDENDPLSKRIKVAVCCNETNSIKARLDEVKKELDKYPYKLGLLIVTVDSDLTAKSIQVTLKEKLAEADEKRLTIALAHTPHTDEIRKKWLTSVTKEDLARDSGNLGSANQYKQEALTVLSTWISSASSGNMSAWNGEGDFGVVHSVSDLRRKVKNNVFDKIFKYAPEVIVQTVTAYKPCKDRAPTAGLERETKDSQLKSVLNGISQYLTVTKIDDIANLKGDAKAEAIAQLAEFIKTKMSEGGRVSLSDMWDALQEPPFGYYDNIACGVLLGYAFLSYENSEYSWTDSSQSNQVLNRPTLSKMITQMVKGRISSDYISRGSEDFQTFRKRIQKIMNLSEAETVTETSCWHNMRDIVTKHGVPFWTLKYLPKEDFASDDFYNAAIEIVENINNFITDDVEHEKIIVEVNKLFKGRGKLREILAEKWNDKPTLKAAFRGFLFKESPELEEISQKLSVQPENLSDKLHEVMQSSTYTWKESQVCEKLPLVTLDYRYLLALGEAMGKIYKNMESARLDLKNLFEYARIPLAVLDNLDKPWFKALKEMYAIVYEKISHNEDVKREMTAELSAHGRDAMDFLRDGRPLLREILQSKQFDFSPEETQKVYDGLKNVRINVTVGAFEQALNIQISAITEAQNRVKLKRKWAEISGEETVKDWCNTHNVPLIWIAPKDLRLPFITVARVQNNKPVHDADVISALSAINNMDASLLHSKERIDNAMYNLIGEEYRDIFDSERKNIIFEAKSKLGNDMSAWDIQDIPELTKILKRYRQDKDRREKLSATKSRVQTMDESALRGAVQAFLDSHPEYCDDFK